MDEGAPKINIPISVVERNKKMSEIRLRLLLGSLPIEKKIKIRDEIAGFVKGLRNKYPDHQNYRLLHFISGSTIAPSHTGIIEDDFPGDDSVEKFLESLEQKYLK